MRYVKSRRLEFQRDMIYRFYVTDALKAISENTSKEYGGATMNARYFDFINESMSQKPKKVQSADDIIVNIRNKLNELGGED